MSLSVASQVPLNIADINQRLLPTTVEKSLQEEGKQGFIQRYVNQQSTLPQHVDHQDVLAPFMSIPSTLRKQSKKSQRAFAKRLSLKSTNEAGMFGRAKMSGTIKVGTTSIRYKEAPGVTHRKPQTSRHFVRPCRESETDAIEDGVADGKSLVDVCVTGKDGAVGDEERVGDDIEVFDSISVSRHQPGAPFAESHTFTDSRSFAGGAGRKAGTDDEDLGKMKTEFDIDAYYEMMNAPDNPIRPIRSPKSPFYHAHFIFF